MVPDKQIRAIVATKLFHVPGPESRLHGSTSPPSLVVQKMRVVEKTGMHYGPTVTDDSVTTNPNLAPAWLPGLLLVWPLLVWGLGNQSLHAAGVYSKFRRAPGCSGDLQQLDERLFPDADKLNLERCNDGWMNSSLIRKK
jgi:hypothetical protein